MPVVFCPNARHKMVEMESLNGVGFKTTMTAHGTDKDGKLNGQDRHYDAYECPECGLLFWARNKTMSAHKDDAKIQQKYR